MGCVSTCRPSINQCYVNNIPPSLDPSLRSDEEIPLEEVGGAYSLNNISEEEEEEDCVSDIT